MPCDSANLALPREVKQDSEFNALRNCLGKRRLIVFQGVSEWLPNRKEEKRRSAAIVGPNEFSISPL